MTSERIGYHSDAERHMAGYLARIATGPTLSKSLSRQEARDGMALILAGEVGEAQAAAFLIALRMKRETHDELCGVLDALRGAAVRVVADVDDLVDLADPYNGHVRHLPAAPFVPAVLAACGVPCLVHGVLAMGPKWGLTPARVFLAAGVPVDRAPAAAARSIERAGWAYVDQTAYCPPLAALARLRTLIVKRPCLSLVEKLVNPVRARGRNHLWVGFAHTGYPEILADLARDGGYDSMLAVRGVESGVLTSLAGRSRGSRYWGAAGPLEPIDIAAREAIGASDVRSPEQPARADSDSDDESALPDDAVLERRAVMAAEQGQAALAGQTGPTRDMLILGAAAMLRHLGRAETLAGAAEAVRTALDSGKALAAFANRGDPERGQPTSK